MCSARMSSVGLELRQIECGLQAVRTADAAAKKAAEVALKREELCREEAAFQKKQQKELAERLKVLEQEKLVG